MPTFARTVGTVALVASVLACAPKRAPVAASRAGTVGKTPYSQSQVERLERDAPRREDFDRSLAALAASVRQLEIVPEAAADVGLREAVGRLASALRDLPYAPESLARPTVIQMRRQQADMELAMPSEREENKSALRAIDYAAELLTQTAHGAYQHDPDVVQAADQLNDAVRALRDPSRLRLPRGALVGAIRQALTVLQEMQQALVEKTAPA